MRDLVLNRNFDETIAVEQKKFIRNKKIGQFELKQWQKNIDKFTIKEFCMKILRPYPLVFNNIFYYFKYPTLF